MLNNNPAGLSRTEIERVVGNQYSRLLRRQQDSKALFASRGTYTKNRKPATHLRVTVLIAERKVTALGMQERKK